MTDKNLQELISIARGLDTLASELAYTSSNLMARLEQINSELNENEE